MTRSVFCKLLQRQTYDILSHRQSVVWCFIGFVLLTVSILHFGETVLTWSKEKYNVVFNSYSDNIAGKSFEKRLCEEVPIDVVYTWVNGTDPKIIETLVDLKQEISHHSNQSSNDTCSYLHCIPTHMVLVHPVLPLSITLSDLDDVDPLLSSVTNVLTVSGPIGGKQTNITILVFNTREAASNAAKKKKITIGLQNYTVRIAYITDDWLAQNAVPLKTAALLTLVPAGHTEEEIFKLLPQTAQVLIDKIFLYEEKSLALLTVHNKEALDKLLRHDNFTFNNKVSKLVGASLILHLVEDQGEISSNRFADNEELRYSLRSLEKHAPWIRHVYIVTNGQIPHWLNLDNPRVTIVTHDEIFINKSHLPTFSSPAIESHLHRIPGLSKKFLYLNDDVMFGKEVWPDDFFTHAKGQKIYLTWPVPDCSEGCPTTWINDGYCDKACNNSECQWDGGDCRDGQLHHNTEFLGNVNGEGQRHGISANSEGAYCNPSCANSWLADRYCDQACNVRSCAYDAGDCGTELYKNLYEFKFDEQQKFYTLPPGETLMYFNLTTLLNNGTVTEGSYGEANIVRIISISIRHKVLTCILYPNFNSTDITMTLKGEKNGMDFQLSFHLVADTNPVPTTVAPKILKKSLELNATEQGTTTIHFEEFPEDERRPKIQALDEGVQDNLGNSSNLNLNISVDSFPIELQSNLSSLKEQLENDELTLKGFLKKRSRLVEHYAKYYVNNSTVNSHLMANLSRSIHKVLLKKGSETFRPEGLKENPSSANSFSRRRLLSISDNPVLEKAFRMQRLRDIMHIGVSEDNSNGLSKDTKLKVQEQYKTPSKQLRHLMDTFGDSLRHVNKLYNEAFGYMARKVPAHVAHLIDIDVMNRLQDKFSKEFNVTSSHKIRSSDDMQFAFSYYYFLMSEKTNVSASEIFDEFDTDKSGTWSDREIRSLIVQLNDLPLDYASIKEFEDSINNCSQHYQTTEIIPTPPYERYYNSSLPLVYKDLVLVCSPITNMLLKKFGVRQTNKYEITGEDEVAFKMIQTNLSQVIGQIDDLRKHPKKFVCLNDNINHSSKEADMVRAVIQDYYETLFPIRSQFELPAEYRNKFLHIEELHEWRRYRDRIRHITYCCLALLITITLALFYLSEVKPLVKEKLGGKRQGRRRKVRQHSDPLDDVLNV